MYQRYYRQRKFGKIFSVFLVIGSGLGYYVREGKSNLKNLLSFGNVLKYEEYFPRNIKDLIFEFKDENNNSIKGKFEDFDLFNTKKEKTDKFKNDFFIYKNNLSNLNAMLLKKHYYSNDLYDLENNKDKLKTNLNLDDDYINPFFDNYCKYACIKNDFEDDNKIEKEFFLELNEDDRKRIESYYMLKNIEKKLL